VTVARTGRSTVALYCAASGDASRTVVMYIYENGFRFFKMGYASTVALSLFLVILALTGIQFLVSRTWVFYR
jgi:multiple sugar transport system permease protein